MAQTVDDSDRRSLLPRLSLAIINRLLYKAAGGAERPALSSPEALSGALDAVTAAHDVIRRELLTILADHASIPAYGDLDPVQLSLSHVEDGGAWRVFMLAGFGEVIAENVARCPKTWELIGGIPNLMQAQFSILEPRKSIPPHAGPFLGYLRYHLGVIVPSDNPPSIRVKDQTYTWHEGEAIVLDDSWEHEVFNTCDQARVVLIIDILRPFGRLRQSVNRFYVYVLARHIYMRGTIMKNLHEMARRAVPVDAA